MTIFNLGSINADHFYQVPHLPVPGETLAATSFRTGLGGKGANQSVAAARAGSAAVHIGSVGSDGAWTIDSLTAFGVTTTHVSTVKTPTAHAIINVDALGENAIVIYLGANEKQSLTQVKKALTNAKPGDILLLQNETNLQVEAAKLAKSYDITVMYSAAPFSAQAVRELLPYIDVLVVNKIEAEQLRAEIGVLSITSLLVTHGADGAIWTDLESGQQTKVKAFQVDPVDTTGAGDCFIGYVAAGLDQNMSIAKAMRLGAGASAIQVTRFGTAGAIPSRDEVNAFLGERETE